MAANSLFLPECKKSIEFRDKVCVDRERPPLSSEWPTKFSSLLQSCWQHDHQRRPCFRDISVMIDAIRLAYVRQHIGIKSHASSNSESPRGISSLPSISTNSPMGLFRIRSLSSKSGLSDLASSGKSEITLAPVPRRLVNGMGFSPEEEFNYPTFAK